MPPQVTRVLVQVSEPVTRVVVWLDPGSFQHMCTCEYCKRCDEELEERAANGDFDVELPE